MKGRAGRGEFTGHRLHGEALLPPSLCMLTAVGLVRTVATVVRAVADLVRIHTVPPLALKGIPFTMMRGWTKREMEGAGDRGKEDRGRKRGGERDWGSPTYEKKTSGPLSSRSSPYPLPYWAGRSPGTPAGRLRRPQGARGFG